MLRHVARPIIQHVSTILPRPLPPLSYRPVDSSFAAPFQRGRERQQRLNSGISRLGGPAGAISSYVVAAGRANGVYVPDSKLHKHLSVPSKSLGYTFRLMLFKYHVWKPNYHANLSFTHATARELIMKKHFDDRDIPLWVSHRVLSSNPIKGIVRSKAEKRMRNALREALERSGYNLKGRRIGKNVSSEEHKNGPVLWGNIEMVTHDPVEIVTADFQQMVGSLVKLMPTIVNHIKVSSTAGFGPRNYPSPMGMGGGAMNRPIGRGQPGAKRDKAVSPSPQQSRYQAPRRHDGRSLSQQQFKDQAPPRRHEGGPPGAVKGGQVGAPHQQQPKDSRVRRLDSNPPRENMPVTQDERRQRMNSSVHHLSVAGGAKGGEQGRLPYQQRPKDQGTDQGTRGGHDNGRPSGGKKPGQFQWTGRAK